MPGPWEKYQSAAPPQPENQPEGPWSRFADPSAKPANDDWSPQASLGGFGQGALAGYLPQAQAAAGGLIPDPNADVDAKLKGQGFSIQQPEDTYINRRDDNIRRMEMEQKENPKSFLGGQLAGAIATSPMAGKAIGAIPGMAKLASLGKAGVDAAGVATKGSALARIAQSAATAGAMGAVQNPGDTEGQMSGLQLGERAENAGKSALLGGALQGGVEGVSKGIQVIKGMPDFLNEFAEKRGAAATGLSKAEAKAAIKADPSGMEGKKLKELGRYVLDNKIVQVGDDITDVANRSGTMKKAVGKQIGQAYDTASELLSDPKEFARLTPEQKVLIQKTNFKPQEMAKEFLDSVASSVKGTPNGDQVLNSARKVAANFAQKGKMAGINDIHEFQSQLDDLIFKSDQAFKRSGVQTPGTEALGGMRDFIKSKIDARFDALDNVFGKSLGSDLKELNKNYGMLSKVNSIARNRLSGDMGNNFLSLTDKMAAMGGAGLGASEGYKHGGMGGAVEGALLGAGAGLVSKAARTYGRPLMTIGADKASGLLNAATPGFLPGAADAATGLLSRTPQVAGLVAPSVNTNPGLTPAPIPAPGPIENKLSGNKGGRAPAKKGK